MASSFPALFIGRFQPFHLGHVDVVKQILVKHEAVIIGIGSSQYSGLPQNPFSAGLRRQMIEKSLKEADVPPERFSIFDVPDIHNNETWISHLEKLLPPFGAVWSGTSLVQKLFQKDGKHPIIQPKFNFDISGTNIRDLMQKNDPSWLRTVPVAVARLIKI
ncbi:MAG: nicotinamide-nucleotide adenylyltransferase [Patescibacteria group bacterium]